MRSGRPAGRPPIDPDGGELIRWEVQVPAELAARVHGEMRRRGTTNRTMTVRELLAERLDRLESMDRAAIHAGLAANGLLPE